MKFRKFLAVAVKLRQRNVRWKKRDTRAKLLVCKLNLLLFLPLSLPSPLPSLELLNHKTKRSTFSQSENASVSLSGSYYRPKSVPDPHPEIKGGGGGGERNPDPLIREGGWSPIKIFSAYEPQLCLKTTKKGEKQGEGGSSPPGSSPGSATGNDRFPHPFICFNYSRISTIHVAEAEKGTLSGWASLYMPSLGVFSRDPLYFLFPR